MILAVNPDISPDDRIMRGILGVGLLQDTPGPMKADGELDSALVDQMLMFMRLSAILRPVWRNIRVDAHSHD